MMSPHFVRKLNDINLRDKMILSYVILLLIPLLIMGIVVVQAFRTSALDDAIKQTESNVDRVKTRTSEMLETAINLADRLSTDNRVKEIASRRYASVLDVFLAYRDFQTFKISQDFNMDISRIKLYVDNPTLVDNWEFIPLSVETSGAFWYRSAMANPEQNGWYCFGDVTKSGNSRLSLVRSIALPDLPARGVLVIDVNTDRLDALLKAEPFSTLIVDNNNVVAAATDASLNGRPLADSALRQVITKPAPGSYDLNIDGVGSKVFIENIRPERAFNQLRIISIFSVAQIVERANQISLAGLVVMLGIFVLALVFISFIYSILANRLLSLSRQIDLVSRGNFTTTLPVDGRDEIGVISGQFNGMVGNISALLEKIRQADEQKSRLELSQKEIRLKMLASQINPHFLFNALESIRMKAHLRGEKDIAQTVKLLGRLMRKNLEAGDKRIALSAELDSVRCYLEIEKFRLEEKLDYRIEVEPAIEGVMVPPLIIEPLVENAVIHGLEEKYGGGSILVRVWREADLVRIWISDDGVGMPPATLESVRLGLGDWEGHHIGLSNVHQRLVLGYGPEHGLVIESRQAQPDAPGGTIIQFSLPWEPVDV
jgi:two-component system sensor histidine kinase YesM